MSTVPMVIEDNEFHSEENALIADTSPYRGGRYQQQSKTGPDVEWNKIHNISAESERFTLENKSQQTSKAKIKTPPPCESRSLRAITV